MGKPTIWRRKYLVKKKMQFKYMSVILLWILLTSLVFGGVIYQHIYYILIKIPELEGKLKFIFEASWLTFWPWMLFLLGLGAISSIFIFHKIAGPLFRIEKELKDKIGKGDLTWHVKLRRGDELQDLATSINIMLDGLKSLVIEDKKTIQEISAISEEISNDIERKAVPLEGAVEIGRKLKVIKEKMESITSNYKV